MESIVLSNQTHVSLPVINQVAAPSSIANTLEALRARMVSFDEQQVREWFQLDAADRPLKTTISLCSTCLAHVPAVVYSSAGRVWMRKNCEQHGPALAIVENDESFYFLSNKDRWGRRYADDRVLDFPAYESGCCESGCGQSTSPKTMESLGFADQSQNKTCTVLVEITNACNLQCKVCYSDAKGDRVLPLAAFKQYMTRLIEQKGGLDSVQLTGGEAILHPQFWEMVDFLYHDDRVRKIYLPTNGILFSRRENAERLVPYRNKLMVLLQFDGQTAAANMNLRNANPTRIRTQVIDELGRLGIIMQLTMTLTKRVNDEEVGWVIDTALRHSHVKVVALQPVTYSGRYELNREAVDRLTLSDVVKCIVQQSSRRMDARDFVPIPCSHPNCGWLTLFVRRSKFKFNITRHIDLALVLNSVAYKTVLTQQQVRDMVGTARPSLVSRVVGAIGRRIVRPTDLLGIAIKPFMDCFNYDQDRISNCCHHLLNTQGQPVSFCEYNARLRESDPWDKFPKIDGVGCDEPLVNSQFQSR